ncbi:ATP-binding protein, partial [Sphingomonas sp. H39-1-10]|uniref:phage terminase large subunit family protein n=1 Tax=Sphingomonas pollutisoli TaxID=3030829 RepID=UPI0023BA23EB
SMGFCYSAEEPERLRGPEHHRAWCDEIGAWGKKAQPAWDNLMMGLRLPEHHPQIVVTTTPRTTPLIRELRKATTTHLTVGKTDDNIANLAPAVVAKWRKKYGNTRLGRQELDGELLEDTPGALWTRGMIEGARPDGPIPAMRRVVIGVDPSGSNGESGDLIGIIAAGLGYDGRGYILEDGSELLSPEGWARKVVEMYARHRADRVVAERNFGGDMVAAVLRGAAPNLPITMVTASRGKAVRAEPVSALYEQGKVSHAEPFPELEDQMQAMTPGGYTGPGRSPDRLDAAVWALTELMLGDEDGFDIRIFLLANGA